MFLRWTIAAVVLLLLPSIARAQQPNDDHRAHAESDVQSLVTGTQASEQTLSELRRRARNAARELDEELASSARDGLLRLASSGDDETRARAHYELGRLAEVFGSSIQAAELYRISLDIDPSGPDARHALSRARNLEEEIAAGVDDAIRDELERLRHAELDDEALIAELDALLQRVPAGRQRAEICNWIGTKLVFELEEHARAWSYYVQIPTMPHVSRDLLRSAYDGIINTAPAAGRIQEGREILLAAFEAHPDSVELHERDRLLDELRDARQRKIAWWLSVVSLAMLAMLWMENRAWTAFEADTLAEWRPWQSLLTLVYVFGGATVFGGLWDAQNLEPMLTTIPGILIVHVLAGSIRWSRDRIATARAALDAVVVTGSTFGAIFLPLQLQDATHLLGL